MKIPTGVRQLRVLAADVKSGCAGDTILGAKALVMIAESLDRIEAILERNASRKKPKLSEWQRFFGQQVKQGYTAKQVAEMWRERKASAA
jgi:hypothetical protein